MAQRRLLVLEFNEICPNLLDRWMGEGKLPNFRRFYDASQVHTTVADAAPPHLEPWVQWYSFHTGLDYRDHKVTNLTDGPRAGHRDIWSVLRERGYTVLNCSSMNARAFAGEGQFYLPDPWCSAEKPHPPELQRFYRIVSHQVKEYTNDGAGIGAKDYLSFLGFLITHGLRFKTCLAILRELAGERRSRGATSWKRVPLLDKLQFDVFRHYFRKLKPAFSTFFINSTAHYQHAYWRHMHPDAFTVKPSPAEIARYGGAIFHGYLEMDSLLGDFFRLEEEEGVTLVLASALSQQPFLRHEATGGQHFHRPKDVDKVLAALDIRPKRVDPVMTHQYIAIFGSADEARAARAQLGAVTMAGKPVFDFGESDPDKVYFGCQVRHTVPNGATMDLPGGRTTPFFDWFYLIEAVKSGCHHPDGVLWFKTGTHKVHKERVSILDCFPTILRWYGISAEPARSRADHGRVLESVV